MRARGVVAILLSWASAWLVFAVSPLSATAVEPRSETPVHYDVNSGLLLEHGGSSIQLQVGTWLRGEVLDEEGRKARPRFTVPLLRPVVQVRLLEGEVLFFLQPELGGADPDPRLLDVFLEWAPSPAFKLRMGQFRTPYSRSFITPIFMLELPTRGLVVDRFRLGRDTGLMAYGQLDEGRYEYDLGVFSGADINSLGKWGDEPMGVGRVAVNFGQPVPYDQVPALRFLDPRGVSVGLGAAWRRVKTQTGDGPVSSMQSWNATADVTMMHGPLITTFEAFLRERQQPGSGWKTSYGAFVQAGTFVWPKRVEVGGRFGWMSDAQDDLSAEAFLTVFWWLPDRYFGHHLKTTLAYRHDDYGRGSTTLDFEQAVLQTQIFF